MKKNHQITYPSSTKIYIKGKIHYIRVAMREIKLSDTISIKNEYQKKEKNKSVIVYDTSGDYSDKEKIVDITKGLYRLQDSSSCRRYSKGETWSTSKK